MADEEQFSQADRLTLSKYNQALSELERRVEEGDLHAEEAMQLRQQVLKMRAPLQQRQQQAEQADQQAQQQQVAQQAQAMEGLEAQFDQQRTQAFPGLVSRFKHPLTGEEAYFYQPTRGQWEQIDFGSKPPSGAPPTKESSDG